MGGTLYVSLFDAAQAATQARLNQMSATTQMGKAQTQILNEVTNSWTQHLPPSQQFSVRAAHYESWMKISSVKSMVKDEFNAYLKGYSLMLHNKTSSRAQWNGPGVMSASERRRIASIINRYESHSGIDMQHSYNSREDRSYNFHVTSLTTKCAKSLLSEFLAKNAESKLRVSYKPSCFTLPELANHAAWAAKHASANTAKEIQAELQQAQRSFQAAQANANAGVQAAQNQSGQDSYMMQQDAMLATTINSALQQTAGLTISA